MRKTRIFIQHPFYFMQYFKLLLVTKICIYFYMYGMLWSNKQSLNLKWLYVTIDYKLLITLTPSRWKPLNSVKNVFWMLLLNSVLLTYASSPSIYQYILNKLSTSAFVISSDVHMKYNVCLHVSLTVLFCRATLTKGIRRSWRNRN